MTGASRIGLLPSRRQAGGRSIRKRVQSAAAPGRRELGPSERHLRLGPRRCRNLQYINDPNAIRSQFAPMRIRIDGKRVWKLAGKLKRSNHMHPADGGAFNLPS
jgi:hypothetical protein